MKINKQYIPLLFVLPVVLVGVLMLAFVFTSNRSNNVTLSKPGPCIPTFRDGGGPYYLENAPFRGKIVPEKNAGVQLIIKGQIWNSDCTRPIAGAVLDIWQANESGDYEDEWYRGQVTADADGYYVFESVMPLGYGEGTAFRPPHIHFKVHIDGQEVVTSQMFFEDVRGQSGFEDAYIVALESESADQIVATHPIILPDYP